MEEDRKGLSSSDLDTKLKGIQKLRSLSAEGNELTFIPASLLSVKGLKKLVVSKNAIETVNVVDGFVELEKFHATDNRISSFVFSESSFGCLAE
jgi:Leucine-rich repeat (LRR) protein